MKNIKPLCLGILLVGLLQSGCSKKEVPSTELVADKVNKELQEFIGKEPESYEFVELDPIFINLPNQNGKGGEQFLSVVINIKLKNTSLNSRIETEKFLIRDRVTKTLSLREPKELADISNRETVAKEVSLVLNAIFEPELTQAYLTYHKDEFNDAENLIRLQKAGVLPPDLGTNTPLNDQTIELMKKMNDSIFPVKGILFKDFQMNRGS
jgi:hypothetical protein